jgi:tryptophanyl-tRNA synthetase
MRILSGIQPSGKLHLGNYFGMLRQCVELQNTADETPLYFIADLHALTSTRNGEQLHNFSIDLVLDFLALGLDPSRSILFRQSDVLEHTQLAWILNTVTPMGLLERSHSYKDKTARGIPASSGLFTYPVLMAADILLYGTDAVPVGKDQKQHLEITRDICMKFNVTYVPGFSPEDPKSVGILKMPEPYILKDVETIPGLDGQKMSKSYNNTIDLFGEDEVVRKKFMSIKTDSTAIEAPKPADSGLLTMLKLLASKSETAELTHSWENGGVGYGTYKKRLAELFFERFGEARAKRKELANDLPYIHQVLRDGAERARAIAKPTIQKVYEAVGIGR